MEITGWKHRDRTLYLVVVSLAIIGLALIFSTWQVLREQRKASFEHLSLTARSVLLAVDSSLRRGMGMGREPSYTQEFFQELEANDDIAFISVSNLQDGVLRMRPAGPLVPLPDAALAALRETGRWQGRMQGDGRSLYLAAQKMEMRTRRMREGHHMTAPSLPQESPYLVVGLNIEKYLAANAGFARAAVFQSAYILGAALFLLFLATRLLARREQADKAVFLEHFQTKLLDAMPDGLLIAGADGVIRAANPAAERILEAAGPENLTEAASSPVGRRLDETPLGVFVTPGKGLDVTSPGGAPLRLEMSCGGLELELLVLAFRDGDNEGRMIMVRDRTAVRALEKNLAEAEKMAAVGALAAGVAHEIRNPLSALRGFAQYFAKKFSGKQPEEEYAATMVREADRLNRVVTDMLYLSRPSVRHPAPVDLSSLADDVESLLRLEMQTKGAVLARQLDAPAVFADTENLKQALINLLVNSLEALPRIPETGRAGEDAARITLSSGREEDGRVWLQVADNGPGMDEAAGRQAFEPFFTTKSKGTGLGLALVHKTMREHGGSARIETAPGRGFAVRLEFPAGNSA